MVDILLYRSIVYCRSCFMRCLPLDKVFSFFLLSVALGLVYDSCLPFFITKDSAAVWSAYVCIQHGIYMLHRLIISTHGSEGSDRRIMINNFTFRLFICASWKVEGFCTIC